MMLVRRGKSGLPKAGCRLTAWRREATESATETSLPKGRVKRGKPHPEQDRIGEEWSNPHGCFGRLTLGLVA